MISMPYCVSCYSSNNTSKAPPLAMVQCNKGLCSCLLVLATQAMGRRIQPDIALLVCLSRSIAKRIPWPKMSPGAEGWGNIVSEPI